MFQFGIGIMVGVPKTGNLAVNPTPKQFGTIQDVQFEISQELKELRGQNKFPEDVAPGNMKGSGKVQFGRLDVDTFNQLLFAEQAEPSGIQTIQANELRSIPANPGPFTIQVANFATFSNDLGVFYNSGPNAGKRFINSGVSAPQVGQYQVNPATGTYTFNTADAGIQVAISYTWFTANVGTTFTVLNHLMGYGPVCEVWLSQPYQGNNGVHLYAVRFAKLGAPLKRDDYEIGEMDFQFYANASGQVMDFFQVSP